MSREYLFSNWSTSRKVRALELMDEYLKKNIPRSIYETQWERYGVKAKLYPDKAREIAEDEGRFIDALFNFYVCLTTDLSWLKL